MPSVLHMDHGGGNNSTFTDHVVTSSGTDTYSAIAASLASLKGPKHGGANLKVVRMFDEMKEEVKDWKDEDEIRKLSDPTAHQGSIRPQRTDLWYGTCRLLHLRPESADLQGLPGQAGHRGRLRGRVPFLRDGGETGDRTDLQPAERFTRASAPISTSTADLCTGCSAFRISFSHRCSP